MNFSMKTIVVYYSLEGNTKLAAEAVAKELGADILPLIPVKAYHVLPAESGTNAAGNYEYRKTHQKCGNCRK